MVTRRKATASQLRQGDLLFVPLAKRLVLRGEESEYGGAVFDPGEIVDGRYTLAKGERTGHAHTVSAAEVLFANVTSWGKMVRVGDAPAEVTHEEHAPITLQPGVTYRVVEQKEYDPRTRRNDIPRSSYE